MRYLKGQLHLHSNMSDADASPEVVAKEFRELGYDFIYFTDHFNNFDVRDIKEEGLLALPGVEWAASVSNPYYNSNAVIHTNALGRLREDWGVLFKWVEAYCDNIDDEVFFGKKHTISEVINLTLNEIYRYGAIPTVNHINWWGGDFGPYDYRELLKVDLPYIMELKNASDQFEDGYKSLESAEYVWDVLLTNGRDVFCAFTDDSHNYSKNMRDVLCENNSLPKHMIPGTTCVMVKADQNQESIEKALRCGDFYASTGVEIEEFTVRDKSIYVKVKDTGKTNNIIFKGKMGIPLKWVTGNEAEYVFTGSADEEYVRVKVADCEFKMALTQPVFQNGKKIILVNK